MRPPTPELGCLDDFVRAYEDALDGAGAADLTEFLPAPDDPSRARLRGEGQAVGPLVSVGFALGALLVGLVLLRSRRRRRPPRRDAVAAGEQEARSSQGVT